MAGRGLPSEGPLARVLHHFCRRTGHTTLNADILRKMALYRINQVPGTMSRKRKRKLAAYDNGFLLTALQAA